MRTVDDAQPTATPHDVTSGSTFIGDLVREGARTNPGHVIVRCEAGSLTYGVLDDQANRLASGLTALGLRAGDSCAVQLPNIVEFIVVWVALARLGVIEVPVGTGLHGDLLKHQLVTAHCTFAITRAEWVDRFSSLGDATDVRMIVTVDSDPDDRGHAAADIHQLIAAGSPEPPTHVVSPSDRADVLFTSGTTGPSKGVLRTHHANGVLARTTIEVMGYRRGEVVLSQFPLFHANARYCTVLVAMMVGGTAVLRDGFEPERFWQLCRSEGVTAFNFMGSLLPQIAKQPTSELDRDHQVRCGFGAPAPAELVQTFRDRFGVEVVEVYGCTEIGVGAMNSIGDVRPGSCGRPVPHLQLEIHDDAERRCPAGVVGQIVVRPLEPFAIFSEYFGMPDATVKAFSNLWFHTGDRAYEDEDGFIYFVDRMKDCVRHDGRNVSSFEVERALMSHDSVADAAVIGVPNSDSEEDILAVVVAASAGALDPATLWRHLEAVLPAYALPRFIQVSPSLPKNSSQRVEKYKLREVGLTTGVWDRYADAALQERPGA